MALFISEAKLLKLIDGAVKARMQDLRPLMAADVKSQMQNLLWGWSEVEMPGLYREFDSVHSRIRALQLQVNEMQTRIDDANALVAAIAAKIDELKARPEGVPVDVFDGFVAQLRDLLAKLG